MTDKIQRLKDMQNDLRVFWSSDKPQNRLFGLYDLIKDIKTEKGEDITVVEIGSYAGVSTEAWLLNFQKVIAVDAWDLIINETGYGEISLDNIKEGERRFKERLAGYKHLQVIKDLSERAASQIENDSVDVVYIDSDHRYEYVKKDIAVWLPKLKKGGIMSGHDYTNIYGVRCAVNEIFGPNLPKIYSDCSWWAAARRS